MAQEKLVVEVKVDVKPIVVALAYDSVQHVANMFSLSPKDILEDMYTKYVLENSYEQEDSE